MEFSRTELNWQAPTTNVDGTPIDYPLDYELGARDSANGPDGDITAMVTIVGTLQPDETYVAPIDQMEFGLGSYDLALRAINRDEPEHVSAWSNTVPLTVTPDPTPAAPVLIA